MTPNALTAFITISLDGYYADAQGGMQWAYQQANDDEWNEFVAGNASGGGALLMGRRTYEMMASYWPTPMAAAQSRQVAEHMNRMTKYVVTRNLKQAEWENTTLLHGELEQSVPDLMRTSAESIAILGSGSVVRQLVTLGLLDELQLVISPVLLGSGARLFDSLPHQQGCRFISSRSFKNGNLFVRYALGRIERS